MSTFMNEICKVVVEFKLHLSVRSLYIQCC